MSDSPVTTGRNKARPLLYAAVVGVGMMGVSLALGGNTPAAILSIAVLSCLYNDVIADRQWNEMRRIAEQALALVDRLQASRRHP